MGKDIYNNVKCRHRIAINKLLESLCRLEREKERKRSSAGKRKEKKCDTHEALQSPMRT